MANAASTIEIELEIRDAINRLGKLEGELKKSSSAMDRVANSTRKMESAFRSAKNAASALVAAISVQQIAQAADTFTNFANQIRIATTSAAEAAAVQKELYRVAQTTGTAIEDTTKLYARLRVAADQLGSSQAETIRITEIVAKSLAAAGTSSSEASGALLQLAQALNSPKVQAEEFNSLIDGMPNLLKEVEKQLGLTAGSLKKFVTDGNLTNQLFKDAILGSADAINEQFGAAQDTIATSLTRISNSFTVLIGQIEQATGIFSGTANVLSDLSAEFDKSDGIVRDFAEGVKILGIAFDKLKKFAINLTKPLRDAFSMFTDGESNPIVTTINYIQAGFGFLSVAAQYEVQNAALQIERLTLHVRDFFVGMVANMFSFFEKVDNFFINQINKIIGYYNSAANAIGMDGDVAPIATSTEAQESALKFERDSAFELANNYQKSADLAKQYQSALQGVAAEFRGLQQQIDSGTFVKQAEQLEEVNLEATNAASAVEKLKEAAKEIEYTNFRGKLSEEQQAEFTRQLEEQFRIRTELGQLTEAQNEAYGQQLEDQFRQVAEVEEYLGRINERGIERSEVEQINYDYANEIAKVKADQNLTIEQEIKLVNALEDAQQRELNNQEKKLTYLDKVNESLQEQLGLSEGAAAAVISGISSAGPNASRAMNIANSRTPEEAVAKLILSNEKVAASIEEYFTILFDTIDPLIDILADLQSAINRLVKALIEGIGNAIETNLDAIGLGPNSYYGGGGFTRDIEALGGGAQGGTYQPTASEALQIAAIKDLRDIVDGQDETLNNLLEAARESGNLTGVVELFKQSINNLIPSLVSAPDLQTYTDILDRLNENLATGLIGDNLQEVVDYYQSLLDETSGELPRAEAYVAVGTAELIIQELASQISGTGTSVSDFEGISDLVTKTAQEQIDAIHFQNLTAEEQIHFRNEETVAMLNAQKIFIQLIDDEERRADLLTKIAAAEAKQLELYNLQLSELQKLNEEREREAQLLSIQNVESGLQALLSDFERTIEKINDLVQGLFDQVNELLFSDFNLAGPQETFNLAQDTYESLLENAFDQDATEDDIKALQGFVNEYLTAARNVFKSSTGFTTIFEGVLGDLTGLGLQTGFNMPIQAASTLSTGAEELLGDLPDELQTAVSDLISGLNLATLAFAQQQVKFLTTVYKIPLTIKNDLLVVDTSGVNKPVKLTNSNFSIDSNSLTQIDLSVLMSTEMFTVNTTALNFGKITPTASAGTPHLGTVTPTVSLKTSSVTSAFSNLTTTVNDAITSFVSKLTETYSLLGIINIGATGSFQSGGNQVSGLENNNGEYGYSNLPGEASFADLTATYLQSGQKAYPYAISLKAFGNSYAFYYENLTDAKGFYKGVLDESSFTGAKKYGFRRGGLVDPLDTIPAMLSPGEYILSPETVRRYGVSNLNRLNSGDTAALNATSDPEVKRLLAELIVAVRENDTEVNVYTDMKGQTKASIEEFRSELRERTRRQGDKFLPARYI
jgi:tape measure domain-containing protein